MTNVAAVLLIGAVLGMVIGLLGGGGGILAVPLLIAVGQPFLVASSQSLVIVSAGALAALVPHQRAGRVDWKVGLTFGVLGTVGAVVGARLAAYVDPAILLGGLTLLLLAGAVAMLRAATGERNRAETRAEERLEPAGDETGPPSPTAGPAAASKPQVVGLASSVGLVTGLMGVGAGFVVVPALVSAMKLPVKKATATALVVIVINSAVALAVRHGSTGGLAVTAGLAVASAAFAVIGALLSRLVPGWALSTAFGVLMILVAGYTTVKAVLGL